MTLSTQCDTNRLETVFNLQKKYAPDEQLRVGEIYTGCEENFVTVQKTMSRQN